MAIARPTNALRNLPISGRSRSGTSSCAVLPQRPAELIDTGLAVDLTAEAGAILQVPRFFATPELFLRRSWLLLMRSLSVRYQFALALVGLNVMAVGMLAWFGYDASRASLTAQALADARIVADAREQSVTRTLERQRDRMAAFLSSVESLCGERTPRRTTAWEPECVRDALSGF